MLKDQGLPKPLEKRPAWQPAKLGCPHPRNDIIGFCWPCLYKKEREAANKDSPKKKKKTIDEIDGTARRIHFERSENYQAEVDYFAFKNSNRGSDKVSLICKYETGWHYDKYLSKNHK